MPENKPSIFLSYGRGDDHEDYHDPQKSFLRKLYTDLTDAGYRVWWDRESMPARGLTFLQEIQDAVTAHDKLVLIVGPYGIQSDYVRAEWEHAQYICKPIIPLLLKGDYSLLPNSMANYHAPDFRESRDYDLAIAELKRILDEHQPDPGTTYSLPLLPRGYIERDKFASLRDTLLSDANSPTVTREEDQTVFIQGSGGIGKSTIASALGRLCEVRRRYDDGVIWVTLGKNPLIAQKQGDIGVLFGDSRDNYQDPDTGKMHLTRVLANKRALIVLDDVWNHKHVQAFMALGPRCRMLVTTRDQSLALKIHGHEYDIIKLTETEGLNLLGKWQGREPSAVNPHETTERDIVNLLDGYTLAVALAGAKLRSGTNHQGLLERLHSGHTFQDLQIDDEDKDYNLEISLYVSYVDLSEADQKRFRQLGVLALNADFDIKLISAIWEDDEQTALDALNRLVDAALLDKTESGRWVQHTVLRAYAHALLGKEQIVKQHEAFGRYAVYVMKIADFDLPMEKWDVQIGHFYPHIDHIGDTLITYYNILPDIYGKVIGEFIRLVTPYVIYRPAMREVPSSRQYRGLDWFIVGANIYNDLNHHDRQATTLNNIGGMYSRLGEKHEALDHYNQALLIRRKINDRSGEANSLNNIGKLYRDLGEKQKALDYFQKALLIREDLGDRFAKASVLNNIGAVYSDLGKKQTALDYFQRVLLIDQEIEDRDGEATALGNIGTIYDSLGEQQKALSYFQKALVISKAIGDRSGEVTMLNNIGGVFDDLGKKQEALEYYHQALPILTEIGYRSVEASILSNIGSVHNILGNEQKALDYYHRALTIRREVGDISGEVLTLNNLSYVYMKMGDLPKSAETLEQIIPITQQIGTIPEEILMRSNLAAVYEKMGRVSDAIALIEQAINLVQEKGMKQVIGDDKFTDMQVFLRQLKGEVTPQQESEMERAMEPLIGLYRSQGADAVGLILEMSGMPNELIDKIIEALRRL